MIVVGCCALILAAAVAHSSEGPAATRVTDSLLALYQLDQRQEGWVRDQSGVGEPVDLRIEPMRGVQLRAGYVSVSSSVTIASVEPAAKITAAVRQSGAFSIEAWIHPQSTQQEGPARIVSLSVDTSQRNVTLGQVGDQLDVRLRTSSTDANGLPSLTTPQGVLEAALTHVVYTRDEDGDAVIYVNGQPAVSGRQEGSLEGWDGDFRLSIANELTGDRPWLGDLRLVAIYGRALAADEVARNFNAGAPVPEYVAQLPPAEPGDVDFVRDIQPIFQQYCMDCHAPGQEEGGLNLGNRQRTLDGGQHGPVVVRGDSASSRLVHLVAAIDEDKVMPPDGDRLSAREVGLLRAWIDQGLEWPESANVLDPRLEQARRHWAFQPLREVREPDVRDDDWARTPIDRFVLARLEAEGLEPSRRADPRQMLRRLYFDLVGLPPTWDEVRAFEAAAEQDWDGAVAEVVDRLLASRHYGERWGRHWLDVARYADSDGQESDRDRPLAYHYRDFVIRAFNDDMPFDQFVRWQLAGDEYEPDNAQAVAATGFLAAGTFAALPDRLMEDERLRNRYNELDDVVSTIGTGMMGLTLACARCHDHKYDAIPARDYYSLMSAVHSGDRGEFEVGPDGAKEKVYAYRDFDANVRPTWLFRRGNYYDHELPVQLGFVSILTPGRSPEDYWNEARQQSPARDATYQRRALAEWMTDVEQGAGALVARVIVNRLWQHHFGTGLVSTPSDFGTRSNGPSHPELLEWLANDLVQHGWHLKRLQRTMLLSAVYQQSSAIEAAASATDEAVGAGESGAESNAARALASDPGNRLLWRMPLQRIEGEILRDSMLAVSGTLNLEPFGPAVKAPIPDDAIQARNVQHPYPTDIEDGPAVRRRSVYLFHKRVVPYPLLQAFDKPDAQQGCSRRDRTTVAPQALALLNDRFVRAVARDFADRLLSEEDGGPAEWIDRGFQLALARSPSDIERAAAEEFFELQRSRRAERDPDADAAAVTRRALADFCQVLFGLNEFIYID